MRKSHPIGAPASGEAGACARRSFLLGAGAMLAAAAITRDAIAENSEFPEFHADDFQFIVLRPRQILPEIALFGLNGRVTQLSSLRGRPILLNFWATWCPACRIELPILERLAEKHRRRGLEILAVSEDQGERATVERFIAALKLQRLTIYRDPNRYVAGTDNDHKAPFGLYGMPITYAIAASGWIVGYVPGGADWMSAAATKLIEFLYRA